MMSMLLGFLVAATLVALVAAADTEGDEGLPMEDTSHMIVMLVAVLMSLFPEEFGYGIFKAIRPSVYPIERKRRMVSDIMRELGPGYTRRAYRMSEDSFYNLHKLLRPHLNPPQSEKKSWKNGSPNGIIISTVRLSIALRYFAGGRPEDIALVHGVSHSEVFRSVWRVVDMQCSPVMDYLFSFHPVMQSRKSLQKALPIRVNQDSTAVVGPSTECCFGLCWR
jgi:hypothetical protein